MIIVKEEFMAGAFDLPYVTIYSDVTDKLYDKKTGKTYIVTVDNPLVIEKYRLEDIED